MNQLTPTQRQVWDPTRGEYRAPTELERAIEANMEGDPNAKWYQFTISTACPLPIPEHPMTRKVAAGGLAAIALAIVLLNSANHPKTNDAPQSQPVPTLKK